MRTRKRNGWQTSAAGRQARWHPWLRSTGYATTDIQYIIHQGFTEQNASYWVGANALLRRTALQTLAEPDGERGYPITRFIQDHTVIEDTESTVDLVRQGWELYNYPARLAYSAIPPDFGALAIQRARWANGGLLILPKLLRYLVRRPRAGWFGEAFMRLHYLCSIAAVNFGLLWLLAVPFGEVPGSYWLPLTALPYFYLYARDLRLLGYPGGDILRVYALNLLLIPVNIGGVLRSLHQGCTGRKIPFKRTPKVQTRTSAPLLYLAAPFVLVIHWYVGAGMDLCSERWAHAAFAAFNATLLGYGLSIFIGLQAGGSDVARLLGARFRDTMPQSWPRMPDALRAALSKVGLATSQDNAS